MLPFHPRPPWLTGRLQTLRALRWPIPAALTEGHRLWLPMEDGDALAAMLHFPEGAPRALPLAVLVHGLAGSEDDPCLREAARGLLGRGFRVLRLNLRGSLPSNPRSTSHYHIGRSEDLAQAIAALPAALTGEGVVLAGWSLGGALALLLAGRTTELAGLPPLRAVAAICPPLQPERAHATIDAEPFLGRALLAMYRKEVLAVPARDLPPELRQAARDSRSVQEFEARVTAPRFGYPSYAVFCEVNRPAAVLPQIRVPTLLLMAADDPLVPLDSMEGIAWADCPAVLPLPVSGGGHCGFYDWRAEAMSVRAIGAFFEGVAAGQGAPAISGPAIDATA
ncbi:alpha/beta fold hydrolase [Roseicella aquatilis]|uniref:Alpha/beta fold hydrolase n=1 Tax=Roseicella aquatilis TaxID=2527868 RepID=A0A4R4DAL1_9PROT|nr:alpha/beta fold hydrolase [Roseicella aquatilis]TCZ57190.1 alpha/beta fold hydrolase [Roseicella aquatilis]